MKELVCLSVFIILAALFAIAMVIAGFICQYKHKTPVKNSIYECGMQPVSDARIQFDIKYFHYAVIFLIFAAGSYTPQISKPLFSSIPK